MSVRESTIRNSSQETVYLEEASVVSSCLSRWNLFPVCSWLSLEYLSEQGRKVPALKEVLI